MDNRINVMNYYQVEGWMVRDLKLKGNELSIYAIIYGFSQDGSSKYEGGLQYLANWTNSTKQGVIKNLKSLIEKQLILKEEVVINNTKYCRYYCDLTKFNTIKQSLPVGVKQCLTNNNNINIINANNIPFNDIKSNDNLQNNNIDIVDGKNERKQKRLEKKQKEQQRILENQTEIYNLIQNFSDNLEIKELLKQYVEVRKQRGLTSAQFRIMLEDLKNYCGPDNLHQEMCLRKAIAGGWSQIVFLDKKKTNNKVFDNTAGHFIGNKKISNEEFHDMAYEQKKNYVGNMALADMTNEQREFFNENCLARDENGQLLEF